jgi:hypothetical protein
MLIVIAEKEELKLVKELGFDNNPILITGVGGINVINALKDVPRDTEILNIGYCGSNKFDIGTRVCVNKVKTFHEIANFKEKNMMVVSASDLKLRYDKYSDCYTSTDFVTKTSIEKPCIFDMELAFIRALFPNTRAIKVVSDKLSVEEYRKNI